VKNANFGKGNKSSLYLASLRYMSSLVRFMFSLTCWRKENSVQYLIKTIL